MPARPRSGSAAPALGNLAWASPDFPVPGQAGQVGGALGFVGAQFQAKGRVGWGPEPGSEEASSDPPWVRGDNLGLLQPALSHLASQCLQDLGWAKGHARPGGYRVLLSAYPKHLPSQQQPSL